MQEEVTEKSIALTTKSNKMSMKERKTIIVLIKIASFLFLNRIVSL